MFERSQMPLNYKNQVKWVFDAYENAGVGLANGFQKDAIQNSIGARPSKKWDGFKCEIKIVTTSKGRFLVVEDSGTVGLTGQNIGSDEIFRLSNDDSYKFPPTERLSRFTSMNNSGGNAVGGGLYGVGKVVYTVASEKYSYYFDSLTSEGKYLANSNESGMVIKYALEEDEARQFIIDNTGLDPKKTTGTRVIIVSPKEEIISAVENGEIIKFIQESFWKTIEKMGDSGGIYVQDKKIEIPTWVVNFSENKEINNILVNPGYRIKNCGLYLYRNGGNEWTGISYYRKGMKIGEIELKEIPDKVKDKFFGFVELDEPWEEALEEIEDNVHFGVNKYKKNYNAYQYLKSFTNDMFRQQMIKWGFIKEKNNDDAAFNKELNEMAKEILDELMRQGFEELGKGPKKASFDVRWKNIEYPTAGSEEVANEDDIKFTFRISNTFLSDRKIKYSLYVIDAESGNVINNIESGNLNIKPNDVCEKSYVFNVNEETANRYRLNKILLNVDLQNSQKSIQKILPFYFDCQKPDNFKEEVSLNLHSIEFPREKKLRVNFGEELKNISYRIDNKINDVLKFRLSISVHDITNSEANKIADLKIIEGEINPFETLITEPFDYEIEEKVFTKYLSEGVVELRARLSVKEDTAKYEKGTIVAKYFYKFFLNQDEKNGSMGIPVESYNDVEHKEMRSRCDTIGGRKIIINTGHPDYLFYSDDLKYHRAYCKNELEKQILMLYLEEGKFSSFGEDFSEMAPKEAVNAVLNKIELTHYNNLI